MLRRLDSAGERTHRQLIDCIRSKDTDALIDAIDSGGIEVNFMDDVGQTLLNWASAFGTQEMVEFLCERGADVNKGQRSSSLHYVMIQTFFDSLNENRFHPFCFIYLHRRPVLVGQLLPKSCSATEPIQI